MAFFAVFAFALPFEINFFIVLFFWFHLNFCNDGRLTFHELRFLDGWQKKWDEWQVLKDEWKKEFPFCAHLCTKESR
jgi:hypothetical protein